MCVSLCAIPPKKNLHIRFAQFPTHSRAHTHKQSTRKPLYTYIFLVGYIIYFQQAPGHQIRYVVRILHIISVYISHHICACMFCLSALLLLLLVSAVCKMFKPNPNMCAADTRRSSLLLRRESGERADFKDTFLRAFADFRSVPLYAHAYTHNVNMRMYASMSAHISATCGLLEMVATLLLSQWRVTCEMDGAITVFFFWYGIQMILYAMLNISSSSSRRDPREMRACAYVC